MITADKILVTRGGWEQLGEELERCKRTRDSHVSEYVNAARGAEPGEAAVRHEQQEIAVTNRRIAHLEDVLSRAVPVGSGDRTPGLVGVGSRVTVRWELDGDEAYVIVGPPEVDLASNCISYESPVGRNLMGRRSGEWIDVETPGGRSRLTIVAVD